MGGESKRVEGEGGKNSVWGERGEVGLGSKWVVCESL